jgi:hypothetical protein
MPAAIALALALTNGAGIPPEPLFRSLAFEGWKREGSAATFTLESIDGPPVLTGRGENLSTNSFLCSPRPLGDFTLEVEVRIEPGTNSGIQVRSRVADGRIRGPQVEIDPSPRAWSGGIYDEGDRGWMQSLEGRDEARSAFAADAWNRYRIECEGPRIRTWVNGVPCADWLDAKSVEGLLAFQVHSGPTATVRWRNPTVVERGRHAWTPMGAGDDAGLAMPPDAVGIRIATGSWTVLVLEPEAGPGIRLRPDGRDAAPDAAPDDAADASQVDPAPRSLDVLFVAGRIAVRRDGIPTLDRTSPPPARLRLEPPAARPAIEALRPARTIP